MVRLLTLLAAGLVMMFAPLVARATAQTYTVNATTDTGAGSGTSGDLLYCVTQANANAGSTIQFDSSLYGQTITLSSTLPITSSMTITGPGANLLTISGGNAVRILTVNNPSGTVTISGVTLADGYVGGGAAILNSGTLLLSNCTFAGNVAGNGGAISNLGTVTVNGCTFSANTAQNLGGAIYNEGAVAVTNSTFAGNTASSGGSIRMDSGTLTVSNSTISANVASSGGGGIEINGGTLTLNNSIVAGNTTAGTFGADDCNGCGTPSHNLIGVAPQLSALGWYGGSTQTMLPQVGSPAIGAGQVSSADDPPSTSAAFSVLQRRERASTWARYKPTIWS